MEKVLILNPYFPTMGGGEKYMGYLCLFLESYYPDIEVDILVFNYNEIEIDDADYPDISKLSDRFGLILNKTKLLKVHLLSETTLINRVKNMSKIKRLTAKYDIFINFMFLSKQISLAKKSIYLCMFPPKKYSNFIRNYNVKILAQFMNWRFYRSYDYFISISHFTNHWLTEYWGKSHKNHIIFPPVFLEKEIEERYSEALKRNIILSVGRFFVGSHNKKQYEMAELFLQNIDVFKSYEFHLVGALSNSEMDIRYVDKIKQIIIDKPIYLHINCEFDEVISLYKQAKIFWHATGLNEDINQYPEKAEHFGITTVEAMSYGAVPVVIAKGGQLEIVKDESGFLWESKIDCIEKTKQIINNDQLRKEFAKNACESAKNFSVEKFFENNRLIFNEL